MRPVVVGITGASGVVYAVRLVRVLLEQGRTIHLIVSDPARLVMREELDLDTVNLKNPACLERLFGSFPAGRLVVHSNRDYTAPVASGSFPVDGMVIIPCTMGTLGAIASGATQNLIHRAAECIMKEGRRLVLVPRETPLSAIHLENMLKLARLGVRIVPAMPGFYSGVTRLEEAVDFMAGKVLDQMDIMHTLYPRWTGSSRKAAAYED